MLLLLVELWTIELVIGTATINNETMLGIRLLAHCTAWEETMLLLHLIYSVYLLS